MFRNTLVLLALLVGISAHAQTSPEDAIAKSHDLYAQHKMNEAASLLKNAIKKFPDCAKCYLELAGVDMRMRDGAAALKALDKAIQVAPTDELRATAHLYRGSLFYAGDKKQMLQAEKDFRDAITLDFKQVEARLKLGVTLIRETREDDGLAEIRKYLEASGPKDDVAYAKKILANPRVARDAMAPEFSVPTADGGQFSLTANAGRIVVIDFWATWCPPCRESVPEIKELLRKYPADKLVVLSASADKDEKTWRSFISKKEMTWPQFFDKDGRLAEMFGVDGYPTYVVIDRDRFIRKRLVGMNPQETIAHKLRDELKSVLE